MKRALFALIVALFSALIAPPARADMGPKPTLDVALPQELSGQVVDGTLLLCQKADCADAQPLQKRGPQGFFCVGMPRNNVSYGVNDAGTGHCKAMAYGFAPYMQLKLKLQNGTDVASAVFVKKAFDAKFSAVLVQNRLILSEQ